MPADSFLDPIVDGVLDLPGVVGIALGGSRARGRATPGSDWDLGVYVDHRFAAADVRDLTARSGWVGHVAEPGEWGPVMNGGAWLTVDGRRVDLLWRNVDEIDRLIAEADAGEFRVVRIPFFVAGIASYVPVGELSVNRALVGAVPPGRPMPEVLRARAASWWRDNARFDLDHCRVMTGREPAIAVALLTRVLIQLAHARRCEAGDWVLNEKHLLHDAGLADVATLVAGAGPDPATIDHVAELVAAITDR